MRTPENEIRFRRAHRPLGYAQPEAPPAARLTRFCREGLIPLWVADGLACAPQILSAMQRRLKNAFSLQRAGRGYAGRRFRWTLRRFGWAVSLEGDRFFQRRSHRAVCRRGALNKSRRRGFDHDARLPSI